MKCLLFLLASSLSRLTGEGSALECVISELMREGELLKLLTTEQ